MALPNPEPEALAASARLQALIGDEILAAGGWISFSRYMELALYAPGLGYYSGGARKFGAAGDFVTAPQLSGLFGETLALQVAEILAQSADRVIEVGAGTGRLAADLLAELERLGSLPERYSILDLSGELRERQRQTIAAAVPHLLARVEWLDRLPGRWSGLLIGNEVLDAMPVHLLARRAGEFSERGVGLAEAGGLVWAERPAAPMLRDAAAALAAECAIETDFLFEVGLAARAWLGEWGRSLDRGAILLLDYGFPRREFYHPQRAEGTLMCHYRHHSHADPFFVPGLQDITTHVDFTAVAEALHETGLDILGYSSQASFLLNCGLFERLGRQAPESKEYIRAAAAVHTLTSPAEMGELFKVIAAGRGIARCLTGFARGDRLHTL